MKTLPLNGLRAFAAVYETGGIRPAARALQITHSSVSRHVHELEAWIGVDLFDRVPTRRTIRFTSQGEALGRAALQAMSDLTSTVNSMREIRAANAVTISTTPSIATRWLLPRLPAFQEAYSWIEISVLAEQWLMLPDDQNADLALRMGNGPWDGFDCSPLMDEYLYPVVGRSVLETLNSSAKPTDFMDLPLLHDRDPQASWEVWRTSYGPADLNIKSGARFASSDLLLRAAAQGMGIALARGRLAEDDVAAGILVRPYGSQEITVRDAYWVVRPKSKPLRKATKLVIDWLHGNTQDQSCSTLPTSRK